MTPQLKQLIERRAKEFRHTGTPSDGLVDYWVGIAFKAGAQDPEIVRAIQLEATAKAYRDAYAYTDNAYAVLLGRAHDAEAELEKLLLAPTDAKEKPNHE